MPALGPASGTVEQEPEAPWKRWRRWAGHGLGGEPRLRPWALACHVAWVSLVALAFLSPTVALLGEVGVFWRHALACIRYPGQLDYGESPLLGQAILWLHGHQIYHDDAAPPFVVGNYPPVFTWATAAVIALWTGASMGAGRIVSVLASLLTAVCVAGCTWEAAALPSLRPGGGAPAGALRVPWALRLVLAAFAGALWLSTRYVWSWGVLGRVDALAVCFSMGGVWVVLRFGFRRLEAGGLWDPLAVGAALFVLAVYTRQDVVEGAIACIAGLAVHDWRRALGLALWTGAGGAAVGAVLMLVSHGQFWVHVVTYNENLFSWATVRGDWLNWLHNSGGAVLVRLGIAGALVWTLAGGQVVPGLLLGLTALTSMTIGKTGSNINYFLPLLAACCWCVGLLGLRAAGLCNGGPMVLKWIGLAVPALFAAWVSGAAPAWSGPLRALSPAYAHLMVHAESRSQNLAHTLRSPGWGGTPTGDPGPEWHRLVRLVAETPGPVISEDMAFVVLAGKPVAFQPSELTKVTQVGRWDQSLVVRRLASGAYPLVILPANLSDARARGSGVFFRWTPEMLAAIAQRYALTAKLAGQWVYAPRAGT